MRIVFSIEGRRDVEPRIRMEFASRYSLAVAVLKSTFKSRNYEPIGRTSLGRDRSVDHVHLAVYPAIG